MSAQVTKPQIVTSALSIIVLLNALFRDVHKFMARDVLAAIIHDGHRI